MRLGAISTTWSGLSSQDGCRLPPGLTISTSAPTIHDTLLLLTSTPSALKLLQYSIEMARWHALSCRVPRVKVGEDSVPNCQACGNSAHQLLRDLTEHPSSPIPPPPPDEPPGQLNLSWPSTVTYTRTKSHRSGFESGEAESLARSKLSEGTCRSDDSSSRSQIPHTHGRALGTAEFRLIRIMARENEPPEGVIHLLLETYSDKEFPEYEAVSYTWGGEDGDATL